jgi:hypothetical protein
MMPTAAPPRPPVYAPARQPPKAPARSSASPGSMRRCSAMARPSASSAVGAAVSDASVAETDTPMAVAAATSMQSWLRRAVVSQRGAGVRVRGGAGGSAARGEECASGARGELRAARTRAAAQPSVSPQRVPQRSDGATSDGAARRPAPAAAGRPLTHRPLSPSLAPQKTTHRSPASATACRPAPHSRRICASSTSPGKARMPTASRARSKIAL